MFDFSEMNVEQLEEKRNELLNEMQTPETRDALSADDLEKKKAAIEEIDAELENRKKAAEKAEEIRQEVAEGNDPVIRTFEENNVEEKNMNFEVNSTEYRDLWIKNLQGRLNEEEKRAYASNSTNAVPTIVSDKFFEKMKKLAPMLSEITLLRVAGNLKFVAEGTRNDATAKHVENSAMAAAADATVSVTLGGFEFMKVIQISRTATMMSIDAFQGWLVEMLAGDIARAIDNYILNDATNGVAALTFSTGTNQILNTATTGYTYKNICDLIALLPAAYDAEAKFLVNKATLYNKIVSIVGSDGHPIFIPDTVTGIGGRLMGYPVVVDDYVATANNALYLGKWTDVVGNLSEDVHVDADESAGFTSNSIMYRGIAVFDSKPAKDDAIVRLVSTAS